mmetsp:Transcript_19281/g.42884  ORF Transcript_19281/g.42884 Transcript_19281/m.42884 type:complete len:201 (+) Transcript_19281:643-1245(+)
MIPRAKFEISNAEWRGFHNQSFRDDLGLFAVLIRPKLRYVTDLQRPQKVPCEHFVCVMVYPHVIWSHSVPLPAKLDCVLLQNLNEHIVIHTLFVRSCHVVVHRYFRSVPIELLQAIKPFRTQFVPELSRLLGMCEIGLDKCHRVSNVVGLRRGSPQNLHRIVCYQGPKEKTTSSRVRRQSVAVGGTPFLLEFKVNRVVLQ